MMNPVSKETLTVSNFFSTYINDVKSNKLSEVDQKKALRAKIALSILSVGIIPAVCWIVKKCCHKTRENTSKVEQAVHEKGIQILNPEKNTAPSNQPQPEAQTLNKQLTDKTQKTEDENRGIQEQPQLLQQDPVPQKSSEKKETAPAAKQIEPEKRLLQTAEVEKVSQVAKKPSQPIEIIFPQGHLKTLKTVNDFENLLKQGLKLNNINWTSLPTELDDAWKDRLKNTQMVIYPIFNPDRIEHVDSIGKDIINMKAANPNLKITMLVVAKQEIIKLPSELVHDKLIVANLKGKYDAPTHTTKDIFANRDDACNELNKICQEIIGANVQEPENQPENVNNIEKISTAPKNPALPFSIIVPQDKSLIKSYEKLEDILKETFNNSIDWLSLPKNELDQAWQEKLKNTEIILYPTVIDDVDSTTNEEAAKIILREKNEELKKMKMANPNLKIAVLALMNDPKANLSCLECDKTIKIKTKIYIDPSGMVAGFKKIIENDEQQKLRTELAEIIQHP